VVEGEDLKVVGVVVVVEELQVEVGEEVMVGVMSC
jgi:hypothetical protein